MTSEVQAAPRRFALAPLALGLVALLTLVRIAALAATPLGLHGDEAQYWAWSRTLDWGYFSKPPLIAWTIAGSTALFGDAEWAVRLAAPIAHAICAAALYALARRLYDERAGCWAALGWALMPGVQFSSVIISTDAILLPFWCLSLLCLWRLVETGKAGWAVALGLAAGFGALAKYAMAYFVLGAALACVMAPRVRRALLSWRGALAALTSLVCLAPNLIWNANHHFATIAHTAADAALTQGLFHPEELLQFLTDQVGVIGPFFFVALCFLFADAAGRTRALSEADRLLLAFAAPALTIIIAQALLSRANANWAVVSYPSAVIWIAGRFSRGRGAWLPPAALALNALIAAVGIAALLNFSFADKIHLSNAFKRARAWPETAAAIAARIESLPRRPTAILVDNRLLFYDLTYYWRDGAPAPLRMWMLDAQPGNSAETSAPLLASESANVFVVMASPTFRQLIFGDFHTALNAGELAIALGPKKRRDLLFATVSGFAPAPRDAAFLARAHPDRGD